MTKLTKVSIHNWKPCDTRQEILDSVQPGLYFIVQPSGVKSWALRYRRRKGDGKAVKHTIGAYPVISLAEARSTAKQLWAEIERGADPHGDKIVARHTIAAGDTFEAAARRYIEMYQFRKCKSWQWTAARLGFAVGGVAEDPKTCPPLAVIRDGVKDRQGRPRVSLADRWGGRRLESITDADIIDMLEKIGGEAPVAANRAHAVLSGFFRWARGKKLTSTNPCVGIERNKEETRDRVLSDDELRRVWLAAEELGHPWTGIVKLLVLTGQRRSEVAGLAWSEIDLDERVIHLPPARTKNGRAHNVPLTSHALAVIAGIRRLPDAESLFTRRRKAIGGGMLSGMKKKLDVASGVTDWTLHDLRRTVASGLQRLGVRLEVTEAVLNHRGGSMAGIVGVYQRHDYADEKRDALARWANYVDAMVSGRKAKVVTLRGRA